MADFLGADRAGSQTRQKRQDQRKQRTAQTAAVPASQSSKKLAVNSTNDEVSTTEPNEHIFGGWRGHNPGKREFSVLECCELEEKRARAIDGK